MITKNGAVISSASTEYKKGRPHAEFKALMKKINFIDSIRNPIITEKATILSEQNKTVFRVHDKANKKTIKKSIEKLFKVNVIKVNIVNQKTKLKMKQGRKSFKGGYKKAIITLKKGQSIDLTTGI